MGSFLLNGTSMKKSAGLKRIQQKYIILIPKFQGLLLFLNDGRAKGLQRQAYLGQ